MNHWIFKQNICNYFDKFLNSSIYVFLNLTGFIFKYNFSRIETYQYCMSYILIAFSTHGYCTVMLEGPFIIRPSCPEWTLICLYLRYFYLMYYYLKWQLVAWLIMSSVISPFYKIKGDNSTPNKFYSYSFN